MRAIAHRIVGSTMPKNPRDEEDPFSAEEEKDGSVVPPLEAKLPTHIIIPNINYGR
jgi:hypothetical protein